MMRPVFFFPKGKSSQTKTAKVLRAWAADLRIVADAFDQSAEHYKNNDNEDGWLDARGAISLFSAIMYSIVQKGTT